MNKLTQRLRDEYVLRKDDVICYLNEHNYAWIKRDVGAVREVEHRQWEESLVRMRRRFDRIAKYLGISGTLS